MIAGMTPPAGQSQLTSLQRNAVMIRFLPSVCIACLLQCASAFSPQGRSHPTSSSSSSSSYYASHPPSQLQLASSRTKNADDPDRHHPSSSSRDHRIASALLSLSVGLLVASAPMIVAAADDSGASIAANSKITTGGASTLQSGRVSVCVVLFGAGPRSAFPSFIAASIRPDLIPPSSSPIPPHPHPHPHRSLMRSSLFLLCLSLSPLSRFPLDDRDNPRRQSRQIRLQGGEPQGRGVPAEHRQGYRFQGRESRGGQLLRCHRGRIEFRGCR